MLELGSVDETVVRRLRLAAGNLDPLAAALRARSAFNAVTPAAAGVGPRAVLCVRSLRDPRPRSCSFDPATLRVPQVWRDRLGDELSRLARAARRPAREAVPASADSVLFADRAELLAGLGADFCRGRAAERWWWRSLLGQAPDARAVTAAWERWAEYAPAALELLSRRSAAAAFALSLPAGAAAGVLRRTVRAHALGELSRALAPPTGEARASGDDSARSAGGFDFGSEPDDGASALAPWHAHAPEGADSGPDVARQSFVGISLMIVRAPAVVRRAEFARRFMLWSRRQSNAGPPRGVERAPAPQADADDTPDAAGGRSRTSTPARNHESQVTKDDAPRPDSSAASEADERARAARPDAGLASAVQGDVGNAASSAPSDASVDERRALPRAADGAREVELRTHSGEDVLRDAGARGDSAHARGEGVDRASGEALADGRADEFSRPLLEAEIDTRFGGLFHLVNLGQYLGLYGDFTTPASPGIELPLWDFVALVGRRLAGPRVERDAIWPLLARLAGRGERDKPGAHFDPPDEWHAHADWLKPFARDRGAWLWSTGSTVSTGRTGSAGSAGSDARGRLRVLHPRGFFVIDVPLEASESNPPDGVNDRAGETSDSAGESRSEVERQIAREIERQLASEIEPYREFVNAADLIRAPRGLSVPWRGARSRWLGHVAAYARARLRLALGAGTRTRIARQLFERRARVCVTATHVDVLMRLADLPVEVRCAGLDRDPGWVPAAGRHVAFHFD